MDQNIFKELQEKKKNLISLADKAVEFGWIDKTKSEKIDARNLISFDEIVEKINKDTLTIGVIGQMKCGKSTFLNSFVFEDLVLPAATTPMTAALSVITYGESKRIVVEFYTKDEWEEQKMQASRSLDEVINTPDESKVKAAKELVLKSKNLGSNIETYLGKTQEDDFDKLIDYVGADGKYVSITKSVTIYYPNEYLKGVEIVDTPGFNDPIVSREERTKEFLKKADVVVVMLYAGRPFDATDRDIIFKNVKQCGIGKVLFGINKYDIPYCSDVNPENEEQIKDYVKTEIRKACRDCNDNILVELINETEPIPISAEMALLSRLPMSKITSSDSLSHAWSRYTNGFGIGDQREMRKWSLIDNLISAIRIMIEKEKDKILFAKPLNAIYAAGDKKKTDIELEIQMLSNKIELLNKPDSELEENEENLSKVQKRLSKKINLLAEDLDGEINNIVRKGKNELEDAIDTTCRRMISILHNEWGALKSFTTIKPRLDSEIQTLENRTLKRITENLVEEGTRKIKGCVSDFFVEAEELLLKYLPDFDTRDFVKSTQNSVQMDIDARELFRSGSISEYEETDNFFYCFFNGFTFGLLDVVSNLATHSSKVAEVEMSINSMASNFDPLPYLNNAFGSKDDVIETIQQKFIVELVDPLKEQIQEIREQKYNKEKELENVKNKCTELEQLKVRIIEQINEISNMKEMF